MKKLLIVVLLVTLVFTCVSCGKQASDDANPIPYPDEPYVAFIPSKDYPHADSVTSMTEQATYVVIGTYTEFIKSWNMYGDSDDSYAEGRLYSFAVEEVLKGSVEEKEILVNQQYLETLSYVESDEKIENGIITEEATWSVEHKIDYNNPMYIEPELGSRYVLFLDKNTYYYGSSEPFMIKLDGESAQLCSNIYTSSGGEGGLTSETYTVNGREIVLYSTALTGEDFVEGSSADDVLNEIRASVLENPNDVVR